LGNLVGGDNPGELHAYTDSFVDPDSYSIADADAYADPRRITDAKSDADPYLEPDANADRHSNAHTDAYAAPESDPNTYACPHSVAHSNAHSRSDRNAHSRSDRNAHSRPDNFNHYAACCKGGSVLFRFDRAGGWNTSLSRIYQRRRFAAWTWVKHLQWHNQRNAEFHRHL
jgi:hypothetical protein